MDKIMIFSINIYSILIHSFDNCNFLPTETVIMLFLHTSCIMFHVYMKVSRQQVMYADWIPSIVVHSLITGLWNNSSLGPHQGNIHKFEYCSCPVYCNSLGDQMGPNLITWLSCMRVLSLQQCIVVNANAFWPLALHTCLEAAIAHNAHMHIAH